MFIEVTSRVKFKKVLVNTRFIRLMEQNPAHPAGTLLVLGLRGERAGLDAQGEKQYCSEVLETRESLEDIRELLRDGMMLLAPGRDDGQEPD